MSPEQAQIIIRDEVVIATIVERSERFVYYTVERDGYTTSHASTVEQFRRATNDAWVATHQPS